MGAPFLTLHRSTLQRELAAAVPAESIHLNHRLSGIAEEPGGVRLRFERGDDVFARIVVGADGVNSTVRRYVCGTVRPVYSGEIGFRGVIPTEKSPDLPTPTSLHIWCGPGTHVVFYGMDRGELVNLLAVYEPDRLPEWTRSSSRAPATTEAALSIFGRYGWDSRVLDLVRNSEGDMNFWALVDLPHLPRWNRRRVMILGDAAHAPLPHQGQGAGQAIEDAYTLGRILIDRGLDDYGATFDTFERQRKERTSRVQMYSRLAGRSYKLAGDRATKRDADWPSLPRRIGWIHRHREEEAMRV
jgi:salicylate hydroxylase